MFLLENVGVSLKFVFASHVEMNKLFICLDLPLLVYKSAVFNVPRNCMLGAVPTFSFMLCIENTEFAQMRIIYAFSLVSFFHREIPNFVIPLAKQVT